MTYTTRFPVCRTIAITALACAIAMVGGVSASPLKAVNQLKFPVPSSKEAGVPGETDLVVQCRGNERTSVMLKGDHLPVADLEILVFEESAGNPQGKLVAHGKGTRDLVGVVFVPERTASYRIVFRNHAEMTKENPYNSCYLTIK